MANRTALSNAKKSRPVADADRNASLLPSPAKPSPKKTKKRFQAVDKQLDEDVSIENQPAKRRNTEKAESVSGSNIRVVHDDKDDVGVASTPDANHEPDLPKYDIKDQMADSQQSHHNASPPLPSILQSRSYQTPDSYTTRDRSIQYAYDLPSSACAPSTANPLLAARLKKRTETIIRPAASHHHKPRSTRRADLPCASTPKTKTAAIPRRAKSAARTTTASPYPAGIKLATPGA